MPNLTSWKLPVEKFDNYPISSKKNSQFSHLVVFLKLSNFSGFLQGETLRMTTSQEFREFGVAMVNYIADYLDNIRDRPVVPKASSK